MEVINAAKTADIRGTMQYGSRDFEMPIWSLVHQLSNPSGLRLFQPSNSIDQIASRSGVEAILSDRDSPQVWHMLM
jgi:hypothetical protein